MSQATLIPTASTSPIFNFKNCEIRTIMQDGQPWFVARDVCAALGIGWSGTSLTSIPDAWQGMWFYHTPSRQRVKFINEPAVYKLAFRSNKPEADEFTNWVASDVLPSIRKTGKYDVAEKPKRTRKALGAGIPPAPRQHLFDRLGLTDWEKVQMGPHIRRILDDERELGPRTIECILLKARYLKAIEDVHRLGNALFTDLGKATDGTYGAAQRAVNKTGTFADPFSDTLYADRYRLVKIATDFFDTAFRAINTSICVARMQGV